MSKVFVYTFYVNTSLQTKYLLVAQAWSEVHTYVLHRNAFPNPSPLSNKIQVNMLEVILENFPNFAKSREKKRCCCYPFIFPIYIDWNIQWEKWAAIFCNLKGFFVQLEVVQIEEKKFTTFSPCIHTKNSCVHYLAVRYTQFI